MSGQGHLHGFPDLPPVWALGTLALQYLLRQTMPLMTFHGPATRIFGWACLAGGLALILWSAWWFWRRRTSIEPRQRPSTLIVEGPYRLNRNPIYTGMAMGLIGSGLVLGGLSGLIAAGLFVLVIDLRFVRGEEALLREAFGAEAESYFARTRRW